MAHFLMFFKVFLPKFRISIPIIPDPQHLMIWLKKFVQKLFLGVSYLKLSVLILLMKLISFHFTSLPVHVNVFFIITKNTLSKNIRYSCIFIFHPYPRFSRVHNLFSPSCYYISIIIIHNHHSLITISFNELLQWLQGLIWLRDFNCVALIFRFISYFEGGSNFYVLKVDGGGEFLRIPPPDENFDFQN